MPTYLNSWASRLPQFPSAPWLGTDASGYMTNLGQAGATSGFYLKANGVGVAPTWAALPVAPPGYLTYAEETGATKTIDINYEYGANRGGGVAFALPASAAVGTRFAITGITGLWSLTQAANQYVRFGSGTTATGIAGSLTATNAGDCITCTCIVADLGWRVTSSIGNITIA